ncbi:MAG: hypothetical protein NXY57DRAFT_970052 [Lentinula lateritia]|nr:MAG: hypothetical protein NXY57DRAFT_970052 [Lentinula lateritia]
MFNLVGGILRLLHSLVLSYPGHSLHKFHQLTHVLCATPTLRALEFTPVVGATFYDKPSDVEALYHVIRNNLLNVNVIRVSFVPTNDVDFGLSHKHAIQKAYKSSHDFHGSSPGIQVLEGCYHTVVITFYDNNVLQDCEL